MLACLYIATIRLMSEMSTPFVNMRWILQQLGKRNDPIYATNRTLTLYSFFLVRIMPIPIYWYIAGWSWFHDGYKDCDMPIKFIITISGVALDYLNIMWFTQLSKGLFTGSKTGIKHI